ncbi:hypothetical protein ACOSP7_006764 [Xanthoceras sorbifolium]
MNKREGPLSSAHLYSSNVINDIRVRTRIARQLNEESTMLQGLYRVLKMATAVPGAWTCSADGGNYNVGTQKDKLITSKSENLMDACSASISGFTENMSEVAITIMQSSKGLVSLQNPLLSSKNEKELGINLVTRPARWKRLIRTRRPKIDEVHQVINLGKR